MDDALNDLRNIMRHALALAAALSLTGAAHAFDTAACPTYFVGDWAADADGKKTGHAFMLTFDANGGYVARQTDSASADDAHETPARWKAVAGKAAGTCLLTLTSPEQGEGTLEVTVLDQDTFRGEKDDFVFRRVQP